MNTNNVESNDQIEVKPEPKKRGRKPAAEKSKPIVKEDSVESVAKNENIESSEPKVDSTTAKSNEAKVPEITEEAVEAEQKPVIKSVTKTEPKVKTTSSSEPDNKKPSISNEEANSNSKNILVAKHPVYVYKTPSKKHLATTFQGVMTVLDDTSGAKELGFIPVKIKIPGTGKDFVGFVSAP